jgi:hypothetical protein
MAKQVINIGTSANDGTGSTLRVGGDMINDNFTELYSQVTAGKKTYKALLSQSGTDAPMAVIIQNQFTNLLLGYDDVGQYKITSLSNEFTVGKTFALISGVGYNGDTFTAKVDTFSANTIIITTFKAGITIDDVLNATSILIEVYP